MTLPRKWYLRRHKGWEGGTQLKGSVGRAIQAKKKGPEGEELQEARVADMA